LGGEEAGLNVYLDDGQLYVGGWSQSGLPGDWGPAFFSTPAAAQTAYVVVVSHRRDAAGAPGRFEAYVNGTRIGLLRPAVNAFAPVRDNAGIGRITATTLYHDRVSTVGERAHARMFVGKLAQRNEWLDPAAVATLTSDLQTRFGLAPVDEALVASSDAVPSSLELDAYPNPTSGAATVRFGLEQASAVRVAVYDALGREVAVLAEGVREAGWHSAVLSGADLASGVYVVRVEAGAGVITRRVTVLR
ncbi:MAG: T9SS type A sorting domain-containing protein, partial [Bacteroidota bacterium]